MFYVKMHIPQDELCGERLKVYTHLSNYNDAQLYIQLEKCDLPFQTSLTNRQKKSD